MRCCGASDGDEPDTCHSTTAPRSQSIKGPTHEQELDEHVDKLFVEAETLKTQIETRLSDVGDFAAIEAKTRGDFKKMRSNIKQISR